MSSGQQMPPWLQEQLMKMQQTQQNLQSVMAQKQQLVMEMAESDKALDELKKVADDDTVYKHAGSILIKSNKTDLIAELEEKKELANTRSTVLDKQEARIKESMQEQEAKINEMMKSGASGASMQQPSETESRK